MNLHRFAAVMSFAGPRRRHFSFVPSVRAQESIASGYPDQQWQTIPRPRQLDVVDDYHGRKISDPYRWLEDTESEETAAWVAAQNEVTATYLQSIPAVGDAQAKFEKIWNYERYEFATPSRIDLFLHAQRWPAEPKRVCTKPRSLERLARSTARPEHVECRGTIALAAHAAQ